MLRNKCWTQKVSSGALAGALNDLHLQLKEVYLWRKILTWNISFEEMCTVNNLSAGWV